MASTSLSGRSRQFSKLDALILRDYGRDAIEDVVGFTFETILFSTYGILFALVVYSIFRRGVRSRSTIIMLLVVVYLYGASVTQWVVDFWATLNSMHSLFMTTEVPIPDRGAVADEAGNKVDALQEAIFDINLIVADAVVIWRTWAIYQGRIKAIVLPSVLLITAFGLSTLLPCQFDSVDDFGLFTVFTVIDITCSIDLGPFPGADQICPSSAMVVWGFSVGTNVVCTVLIGFKAWRHRKMLKQLKIGGKTHGMSTQNILSLLVESGFIYIFLLSIQIICYLDIPRSSPWYYFEYILVVMGQQVTGMYPTLIIAIVNFKRTIWEEHPSTRANCTAVNSSPWEVNAIRSGETRTFNSRSILDIFPEKPHDEQGAMEEV
ncbi:hypothetical protein MSAN_01207200 [Mycena sanguinolenta]|uniref:Uncharacterized protein n=1 Tax=Mycena sanguinolenta TaxID=230812 RepID=A0A8H6YGG1_9AGAR|nr:hypothetical protein MSAN_01207200 [Mycena sanguinolenta]